MKRAALWGAGAVGVVVGLFVAVLATRQSAQSREAHSPLLGQDAPRLARPPRWARPGAGRGKGQRRMSARRILPWLALVAVLVVALVVGTRGESGKLTVDQRVHRVADELRCPTCRSQSMADSDAAAAKA